MPESILSNSAETAAEIDRRIASAVAALTARIDGMEKAVTLFQADLTRVPTQLDRAISGLRELIEAQLNTLSKDVVLAAQNINEISENAKDNTAKLIEWHATSNSRYESVKNIFVDRDAAVDNAFAAAKEATAIFAAGFTKAIDPQQSLMQVSARTTDDKISDLKDRLTAMENRTIGITGATIEHRALRDSGISNGYYVLASIGAVVAIGISLFSLFHSVTIPIARSPVEQSEVQGLRDQIRILNDRLDAAMKAK